MAAPAELPALKLTLNVCPTEVDLFMFSASTWLTHRIHFDREYARVEGHRDLVVHGPLQAAYLSRMLEEFADPRGGSLRTMTYRHQLPVFVRQVITCTAELVGLDPAGEGMTLTFAIAVSTDEDGLATSGRAEVWLPRDGLPWLSA
jgi:hydroxyacyl-ACP dehydratase HTD2-like protein with hotdog domain